MRLNFRHANFSPSFQNQTAIQFNNGGKKSVSTMVFGVDDFLAAAIAASTSYIAWSRIDHLMDKVTKRCKPQIRRHFERASESPTFLLKGFEVVNCGNVPHRGRFNHKRSAAFLLSCSLEEMEAHLPSFTRAELQYMFSVVGMNGLWEQGVRLTKACVSIKQEIRPSYVEATLHACITHCEFGEAATYFASFGHAMPISQPLLTAMVVGCSENGASAKEIVEVAATCHRVLSAELISAGVVATAHYDWEYAVGLLRLLKSSWPGYHLRDVLASLTHAALSEEDRVDWLLKEVSVSCPTAVVDVYLRMLETPTGTQAYNERSQSPATWRTAVDYYHTAPSSANALSCSQSLLCTHYNPSEVVGIVTGSKLSDVQWSALGAIVGSTDEGHVAAALTKEMILKSNVSPAVMLKPVAKQGMWPVALRLLTLSLTHRRVIPSSSEIGLAVRASISLKKWASAYFWLERSHASLTRLPSSTYDCAFEAARHMPWDSTTRVLGSMRDVGGCCTEEGILTLLSAAADHRRSPDMLRLLTNTNTIYWIQ